jgi:hypothetical protein
MPPLGTRVNAVEIALYTSIDVVAACTPVKPDALSITLEPVVVKRVITA